MSGIKKNTILSSTENFTEAEYAGRTTLFKSTGPQDFWDLRDLLLSDTGAYKVTFIPSSAAQMIGCLSSLFRNSVFSVLLEY